MPEALSALPDGVTISWYRYNIRKENEKEKTESQEVIAADKKTAEELQKEQNAVQEAAEEAPEIILDELILSDNNRLVILDYGGGTDTSSVEEAVQGFLEPLLKQ